MANPTNSKDSNNPQVEQLDRMVQECLRHFRSTCPELQADLETLSLLKNFTGTKAIAACIGETSNSRSLWQFVLFKEACHLLTVYKYAPTEQGTAFEEITKIEKYVCDPACTPVDEALFQKSNCTLLKCGGGAELGEMGDYLTDDCFFFAPFCPVATMQAVFAKCSPKLILAGYYEVPQQQNPAAKPIPFANVERTLVESEGYEFQRLRGASKFGVEGLPFRFALFKKREDVEA